MPVCRVILLLLRCQPKPLINYKLPDYELLIIVYYYLQFYLAYVVQKATEIIGPLFSVHRTGCALHTAWNAKVLAYLILTTNVF